MKLAAIVVTYNSAAQIERCLAALLEGGASVVVVDNASRDGTVGVIGDRFPDVHLLANAENHGFARAVNQGLAGTDADTVLLVNPDCVVPPATARGLADHLAAKADVGIVAPRLVDAEGRVAVSAHPFETPFTVAASRFGGALVPVTVRRLVSGRRRRRSYDACRVGSEPVDVDWLSGACLAVRGALFRQLGGLDEGYFMYYEDEELCLQAWRAGARVVFDPTVAAFHLGGASSSDPAHVWPHLYRSLLRFQARHRPRTYALVRATVLARALVGIALGAGRDAASVARRRPAGRARAWGRIARIAAFEAPRPPLEVRS